MKEQTPIEILIKELSATSLSYPFRYWQGVKHAIEKAHEYLEIEKERDQQIYQNGWKDAVSYYNTPIDIGMKNILEEVNFFDVHKEEKLSKINIKKQTIIMTKNEIKKYLYKNKPLAALDNVSKKGIVYKVELIDTWIYFLIPLTDIGDATFSPQMEAQLLIRYIYD